MEMTTAIILGYIGVALMVGLSGAASGIGTSIAGQASFYSFPTSSFLNNPTVSGACASGRVCLIFYQTLTKLSIPMIKLGHKIILAVLALLITPPPWVCGRNSRCKCLGTRP